LKYGGFTTSGFGPTSSVLITGLSGLSPSPP
jgi:hypothetical protein